MWLVCGTWLLLLMSHMSVLALLPCLSLVVYTLMAPSRHAPPVYWRVSVTTYIRGIVVELFDRL